MSAGLAIVTQFQPLAKIAFPIPEATPTGVIRSAEIDLQLEKNLAEIITSQRAEPIVYLYSRRNEPEVAQRLAHIMMTSDSPTAREAAEHALFETTDQIGSKLLEAEYLVRKLSVGAGKFGTGPTDEEDLIIELKELREEPLVIARLVETLVSGSSGAFYAAQILQGTPDQSTQLHLKNILIQALDESRGFISFDRANLSKLPFALKYSTDPEVQTLLIKAFKEAFGCNNFRYAAACALGGINTEEARTVILESVFAPKQEWLVRMGIANALREQMDDQVKAKLLPLIDGPVSKTLKLVMDANKSPSDKIAFLSIFARKPSNENIHDIRVQVAIALQEEAPDLVKKVLVEALKPRKDSSHSCQFFASGDANWVLARLVA